MAYCQKGVKLLLDLQVSPQESLLHSIVHADAVTSFNLNSALRLAAYIR
jgi:hypothetical protein